MNLSIEALKGLFETKQITVVKVKQLYSNGVITIEEYNYILGKEG